MPLVSSLFVYPIKSCRGVSCTELRFDTKGIVDDRRLMLVDAEGTFISLRRNANLSLIQPRFHGPSLAVQAPNMETLLLKHKPRTSQRVKVWRHQTKADDMGDAAADWFSRVLGESCRLVRFRSDQIRRISQRFTQSSAEIAFADGYPLLLTSVESLGELNRRLKEPVPMNRFRPNIVVRDCRPFEEDTWSQLNAENVVLELVKPCDRCIATGVNQETQERGPEPLRTLTEFRRSEGGVLFGQNGVATGAGPLRVGEVLQVVARHPAPVTPALDARRRS